MQGRGIYMLPSFAVQANPEGSTGTDRYAILVYFLHFLSNLVANNAMKSFISSMILYRRKIYLMLDFTVFQELETTVG